MINNKQMVQEEEYEVPYHWFISPNSVGGRIYFGYLSICTNFIKSENNYNNLNILDAGCGDARFLKELELLGVESLYGIDYSERAVSFAKLLLPKVEFKTADLSNIPYENNKFDYIFSIETIEHIIPNKISAILGEFARVLKPKGKLIITTPSLLAGIPSPDGKHYQHFSEKSLRDYLAPHFKNVRIFGQDKSGFHPLKVLYRLIDNKIYQIHPLKNYYNINIWPKLFNYGFAHNSRRLIAECSND